MMRVTERERAVVERDAVREARRFYLRRGYRTPHCEVEDLVQVARIAAWAAEARFEAGRATFRTYAADRVRGALLHSMRDGSGIPRAVWDGRRGFAVWEETPLAMEAWAPNTEDERIRVGDQVLDGGSDFRDGVEWLTVVRSLPERLATVIYCRYWLQENQREMAARLGCSQMHVSRLEKQALSRLRTLLGII